MHMGNIAKTNGRKSMVLGMLLNKMESCFPINGKKAITSKPVEPWRKKSGFLINPTIAGSI